MYRLKDIKIRENISDIEVFKRAIKTYGISAGRYPGCKV